MALLAATGVAVSENGVWTGHDWVDNINGV